MRIVEYEEQGEISEVRYAEEGKFLLQGYDAACDEWFFEGTIQEVWDFIIREESFVTHCMVALSNGRGEVLALDLW